MSEELKNQSEQNLPEKITHPDVDKIKQFYSFLNGGNIIKLIEAFTANKKTDNETLLAAYRLVLVLVGLLLFAIIISGYLKLIDSLSTGTLIGAIVGYVLGSFRREA